MNIKSLIIHPILKEDELVKCYIQWESKDIEMQNDYIDMNAHVDIHEKGKPVISMFEYSSLMN